MKRSKKVFAGMAIVFVLILVYVSYDISRRTTSPGSKGQLMERIKDKYDAGTLRNPVPDSIDKDSTAGRKAGGKKKN
jgi:hypothetical protein